VISIEATTTPAEAVLHDAAQTLLKKRETTFTFSPNETASFLNHAIFIHAQETHPHLPFVPDIASSVRFSEDSAGGTVFEAKTHVEGSRAEWVGPIRIDLDYVVGNGEAGLSMVEPLVAEQDPAYDPDQPWNDALARDAKEDIDRFGSNIDGVLARAVYVELAKLGVFVEPEKIRLEVVEQGLKIDVSNKPAVIDKVVYDFIATQARSTRKPGNKDVLAAVQIFLPNATEHQIRRVTHAVRKEKRRPPRDYKHDAALIERVTDLYGKGYLPSQIREELGPDEFTVSQVGHMMAYIGANNPDLAVSSKPLRQERLSQLRSEQTKRQHELNQLRKNQ